MAGFFQKLKGAGSGVSKSDSTAATKNKKDEPQPDLTPVEKLLHNAGPIREDGSDKFFGLENFGNTCYCNSIVQALYHSEQFREHVVNYPPPQPGDQSSGTRQKVNVTIRPPPQADANGAAAGPSKPRQSFGGGQLAPAVPPLRPEDKPDSPEYKKKQALIKGPVLELAQENKDPSGMEECTFTGLRDIFTTFIDSQSRTGVLSPQRFLDIFKRNNEMFRNSMHQDAHEFYGIVLNDVIANVEANGKRMQELAESRGEVDPSQTTDTALSKTGPGMATRASGTGWVHDIFEGVLTSETRCLTCETASQRDETFLDLSIDLEEHSSVTACLQSFSAEEMLCERNKFHCDHCGGLQEAEKRMKVKKLPKVLALHLKRFKYTEDYSRLQKLFHRVVYPYHLRMFNTTDDAEDPDRMYELYAVVVHIGGNAYHGHYVAVIKTKDRGWLLFDDEMVEPVDKHFVRNFFGDKPGMACAYVLFYQETTFEKVREEMDAEGVDQVKLAAQAADLATAADASSGSSSQVILSKLNSQPLPAVDENETLAALDQTKSAPTEIDATKSNGQLPPPLSDSEAHPLAAAPPTSSAVMTETDKNDTSPPKTKDQIAREKKELKAREKAEEKARKAAEKEQARVAAKERQEAQQKMRETARLEREQFNKAIQESKQMAAEEEKRQKKEGAATTDTATSSDAGGSDENHWNGFLNRTSRTSKTMARKSMTRKSFAFLHIGQNKDEDKGSDTKADKTDRNETNGENRVDKGESSAGGGENGASHYQNGSSSSVGPAGKHNHLMPRAIPRSDTAPGAITQLRNHDNHKDMNKEKDPHKPALKERFTFGLGKKKSSKFLSPS
ncbi:hypothetical protein B0I37DRAFT_303974 [Chaetomium sp. MPI-CAGE-AT-0009]|nr:hypothetical protein B0I37DRAFT_303974 [Chaetomium sp. MPI-CAGE-AT-0009]